MHRRARNILLVNPWIHDFTAFDLWMKPLGLLYVAAVLEEAGYEVSFIDCVDPESGPLGGSLGRYHCHQLRRQEICRPSVFADVPRRFGRYGMTPDEFRQRLEDVPEPQVIGVSSMMTYWYPGVAETISVLKDRFPKVPVVLGGVYATLCTEHAGNAIGADVILPGRGERAMLEFVGDLLGVKGDPALGAGTLDDLPTPAYHLYGRLKSVAMLASQGCPYRCTYCASHELSRQFALRDVGQVVDEIEGYVTRFGTQDIALYDDALLADASHIEALLDAIIARGLRVRFHTPNGLHAEQISPALARKLRAAGFGTIRIGFETSDAARQQDSSGKITNDGLRHSVRSLYDAGFTPADVMAYVLAGLPGQPAEEVLDSIRLVHEAEARVSLSQFSPVPGTVDFDRAVEGGFDGDEPLLANKTVYAMRAMGMTFEEYEALRRVAKEGNARLSC